ncbi:hypothetical protein Ancab_005391 [Ancistrocladus abbreviatus]
MAKNGKSCEALKLFGWMRTEHQIEPNSVAFLSALPACAHAGLIGEGQEIFKSLERNYSLKLGMEHYACMADLLGCVASIQQAWEFVMAIPEKPNSDVWAALLSSRRLHGELKMANMVASEDFKFSTDRWLSLHYLIH